MTNKHTQSDEATRKDKLYQLLLEEISAYHYLAETILQKQDAIIRNEIAELESLTGVERLLVKKVETLVRVRERCLREITRIPESSDTPTLSQFIEHLSEQEKPRWHKVEQRMRRYVERIRRTNLENQRLIRASLNYINGVVEMLYPHTEGVYDASGQENRPAAAKPILNVNV